MDRRRNKAHVDASLTQGNTTKGSDRAPSVHSNDDTVSEASAEASVVFDNGNEDFGSTSKQQNSSPTTAPSTSKSAKRGILPPILLSPSKSSIYNRRASASPTRVPPLPSPSRRPRNFYAADNSPPSPETHIDRFSIFNALLKYPELTLEFAKALDIEDLVSLYAISKDFHFLVNARFTTMMLGQARVKAPKASPVFIWRCYRSLCMHDPARRINERHPDEIRAIPSFRWLRMVTFRETIVDDILQCMADNGHRLPKRVRSAIMKIWFTIDISDNARRLGLLHNTSFWTNKDLFGATMFFLKLDMRLTDPVTGNGELRLRKMLLGQRSLSTLAKVLKGEELTSQLDMLRMKVQWDYEPPRHRNMSILGIPPNLIGKLQYEGWGVRRTKFIDIESLVMREALRRKLGLHKFYVDMMIFGYIDKKTFEDIRVPEREDSSEEEGNSATSSEESDTDEREEKAMFTGSDDEDNDQDTDGHTRVEDLDMDYSGYGMPATSSIPKGAPNPKFKGN